MVYHQCGFVHVSSIHLMLNFCSHNVSNWMAFRLCVFLNVLLICSHTIISCHTEGKCDFDLHYYSAPPLLTTEHCSSFLLGRPVWSTEHWEHCTRKTMTRSERCCFADLFALFPWKSQQNKTDFDWKTKLIFDKTDFHLLAILYSKSRRCKTLAPVMVGKIESPDFLAWESNSSRSISFMTWNLQRKCILYFYEFESKQNEYAGLYFNLNNHVCR